MLFKGTEEFEKELENLKQNSNLVNFYENTTKVNELKDKIPSKLNILNIAKNKNLPSYSKLIVSTKYSHVQLNECDLDEEKVKLYEGMCFGEWGIVYKAARTASAYTLEDTHIIYIDKDFFKICFYKNIHRSLNDKRNFLLKILPFLKGSNKLEEFIRNTNPLVNLIFFTNFCLVFPTW